MSDPVHPRGSFSLAELATDAEVEVLLSRSQTLGSDPRVTNYGGGNTSCKTLAIDVVTGHQITLLWIKGSGGDLATLTPAGLAVLVLDRIVSLVDRYTDIVPEGEIFDLLEHCRYGSGGAAPSIDTFLHALLPEAHVDHVHPDAIISIATASDGERLTKDCFGDQVGWLPWKRPGLGLAVQLAAAHKERPDRKGIVLGGHGLFAWGATSADCERATLSMIDRAEAFLAERGCAEWGQPRQRPSAQVDYSDRRRRAAAVAPIVRGLCSSGRPVVGHFNDAPEVLEFLARSDVRRLADLGTSCPDHLLRTKLKPLLLDPDQDSLTDRENMGARVKEYGSEYEDYYLRHRDEQSPPMRGADPAIVLLLGIGMLSFGSDARAARIAGEYYLHAIAVMRGAEAVSSYVPIPEAERFGIEYWQLEEAKLRRAPAAAPLSGRVALVTGAASGIGRAIALRLGNAGAALVLADVDGEGAQRVSEQAGGSDHAVAVEMDVSSEDSVDAAMAAACLAFGGVDIVVNNAGISLSRPLVDTTLSDWIRQHDVLATGSFLVSRAAARLMVAQKIGGDIVYVVSKNSVMAASNNVAYGAAKADQAHQVRLLAAELGEHGIRVNGVNPDGVVKGSGIFASGWGAERAAIYGVTEEELGVYYAERTLLKREVLPEHVANAVFAILAGDLALTTGCMIPVDGGVPAAFLR